jgi:hypothetical protein
LANLAYALFSRIKTLQSYSWDKTEAKYREEQWAKQPIVFLVERTVDEYTFLEPGTNSTRHDFLG